MLKHYNIKAYGGVGEKSPSILKLESDHLHYVATLYEEEETGYPHERKFDKL